MTFRGFDPALFTFLEGLKKNNKKSWFDAHRADYDAHYIEAAKAFIDALEEPLTAIRPNIHLEPRVNGSIFRINRDVRFSKDKTPYKTNLDLWFWEGDGRSKECAAFMMRLNPDELIIGAGMHMFCKPVLAAYRDAVADKKQGAMLDQALRAIPKKATAYGEAYKKVPRGYDAEHPRAELLKKKGLAVMLKEKPPKSITKKSFVSYVCKRFEKLSPVMDWLVPIVEEHRP